ncbi:MAG TPA: hypothetical protein EYG80_06665 [Flavobacteriaceae bacterium]|nr:hypothetical protein [Flavobacteriaceae bacterium]
MSEVKKLIASRINIARIFFIISALYGLSLRLYKIVDFIPVSYKNILQAHSHVTFLGWGFLAVISIVGLVFYPEKIKESIYLKRLFSIMTFTLFGMLISFPLQGYKVFSIAFLSVFLITSYLYLINMLNILKANRSVSAKYVKTGVYYYFISSLAIWLVAIITVKFGKIDLYYNTVYFYLHFLYNGFFVFVLFGLLIKHLEKKEISINKKAITNFYRFTNSSLIPAYALSLLWTDVPSYVYYIGFVAVFLQLISLYYLYSISKYFFKSIESKHIKAIAYFVMVSYFLKIILQFFSAFPQIFDVALQYKPYFIIGYLHLYTLGFMSMFIILLLKLHPKIELNKLGVNILMVGIFLSELFLFLQGALLYFFGVGINNIDLILFLVSILMPLGLIIIHVNVLLKKQKKTSE